MSTRRLGATALALAAALLLAACSSPAATPASDARTDQPLVPLAELEVGDPKALTGPSTALLGDDAIEPVADDPEPVLPATVTSKDLSGDREVVVDDTSRIIAMDLSGSLAATVWGLGLGDRLVGRDISTTFPGSEDLPVVTSSGHSVNAEAVIAEKPTVVLTDGSIGPIDVVEQLRDVGIPVVFFDADASFEGAADLARQVGAALGVPEEGEALAERIAADVAETRAEVDELVPDAADERLRMVFLYLRGSAGVYYLFGDESGADHLIEALGGIDVAGELGWSGMQPLTDEAMVAADPDLILVMSHGIESVGGVDGLLEEKPAIALTTAGEQRRFVDMADGQILSFGPRSADVLDALARAVYAPGDGS